MIPLPRKPLLTTLLATLLTVACSIPDNSDKQIFRYNESAGIATLDPAFAKDQTIIWACTQLYNGLIRLDEQLQPQPCIAKRWDVSPDGKCYTFILRDDVYFHKNELFATPDSTRTVKAHDFLYSFNRIIDPDVASPGRWVFDEVDHFQAIDDTTFVIYLKQPFSPFLSLTAQLPSAQESSTPAKRFGTLGHGTATRRAHGCSADRQTNFLEFIKGNLDFMNSLDAAYKDELLTRTGELREKYADRIDMVSTPFLNTEYLGFRMEKPDSPLHDRRIRQAINYGFDRRKMMKYLRNGIGQPGTGGMVPCGLPGFDTVGDYGYEYNPQKALQLLEQAGYPHGKGMPTLTLSTTSNYLDLCKYIQQQLGLLGINVKVDVNPPAALREQIAQGKSSWFRGSWIADYPDAENYLSLFYSGNRCPAGANYTRYSNPQYDRLYLQAKGATDPQRRIALYRQMDKMIMEEAPVIVLYYDQVLHFTHKNVHGLRSNAMNALDLRYVTIDKRT